MNMKLLTLLLSLVYLACSGTPERSRSIVIEIVVAETELSEGLREARDAEGQVFYLHPEVLLDTRDIASAEADEWQGRPVVQVEFTEEGSEKFARVTGENKGKRLAILIDGRLITAPHIMESITGGVAVISGLTSGEAGRIARELSR